jgi:hypothetical protein
VDEKSAHIDMGTAADLWLSLAELRREAIAQGCTPAQFTYAVEASGKHPIRIARYLKLHNFLPQTFDVPNG